MRQLFLIVILKIVLAQQECSLQSGQFIEGCHTGGTNYYNRLHDRNVSFFTQCNYILRLQT
jgi:hypothetical protein